MSSSTKRKFVTAEVRHSFDVLPDKERGERIARLVAPRGNNLHEVEAPKSSLEEDPNTEIFLASMPNKFRKSVWVKRGDYVVVAPIEEGQKVRGEIVRILYKEQVKYLKSVGHWPKCFEKLEVADEVGTEDKLKNLNLKEEEESDSSSNSSSSSDSDLFRNPNRPTTTVRVSEASSGSESDDEYSTEDQKDED